MDSDMNVQATEPYKRALAAWKAANYDISKIGVVHVDALRDDDATRATIDAARRPVEVRSRPAATTAAQSSHGARARAEKDGDMSRELTEAEEAEVDAMITEFTLAVERARDEGDTDAFYAAFKKHCGTKLTLPSAALRGHLLQQVIGALLIEEHRLLTRIRTLEANVKQLDAAPSKSIEYRGVWDQQTVYGVGNACTHAGSLWIAKTASVSRRPGSGDGAWQLAAKRGADAKNCACKCAAGDKDPQ